VKTFLGKQTSIIIIVVFTLLTLFPNHANGGYCSRYSPGPGKEGHLFIVDLDVDFSQWDYKFSNNWILLTPLPGYYRLDEDFLCVMNNRCLHYVWFPPHGSAGIHTFKGQYDVFNSIDGKFLYTRTDSVECEVKPDRPPYFLSPFYNQVFYTRVGASLNIDLSVCDPDGKEGSRCALPPYYFDNDPVAADIKHTNIPASWYYCRYHGVGICDYIPGCSRYTVSPTEPGTYYITFIAYSLSGSWCEYYLTDELSITIVVNEEPPELTALEVTQAIQDWQNSVTIVENKSTFVRAFFKTPEGGTNEKIEARLHAYRNGEALPYSNLAPINLKKESISHPDPSKVRHLWEEGSLNFELPELWLHGNVDLVLERKNGELNCNDLGLAKADAKYGLANACMTNVTFEPAGVLEVAFIGIPWNDDHKIKWEDINDLVERLKAIYPISEIKYKRISKILTIKKVRKQIQRTGLPKLENVITYLLKKRRWDECWRHEGCDRIYYGVIPKNYDLIGRYSYFLGFSPEEIAGEARCLGCRSAAGYIETGEPFVTGRQTHSHEIAHSLGRDHPAQMLNDVRTGFCGEDFTNLTEIFPYAFRVFEASNEQLSRKIYTRHHHPVTNPWPTLGPMNLGDESFIYGLDTDALSKGKRFGVVNPVVNPKQYFELMSCCYRITDPTLDRWISKWTYEKLLEKINLIWLKERSSKAQSTRSTTEISDYMYVGG